MTALALPRLRRVRPLAVLAASATLVVAVQVASVVRPAAPLVPAAPRVVDGPVALPEAPIADAPDTLDRIDAAITAWSTNVAANDRDFLSARNLGLLYEARARLGGDASDYVRAEEAATRSLAIEPRQLDVQALHARILLSTHQFARALTEASAIDRAAPDQAAVLAIMGDATLELGDLDGAAAIYARLQELAPSAAVTARHARIAFLRADTPGALALAAGAYAAASDEGRTGPSLSWFAFLVGTLTIDAGDPDGAEVWFERALEAWPNSFQALAGQARVAAARGDAAGAIEAYEAANAVSPQPAALRFLGDLLALEGDEAGASAAHDEFLDIVRPDGRPNAIYSEELIQFLADHDRDVVQALRLAEENLDATQDAHAYDAYAWALHANHRGDEAQAAIKSALELAGRDATVLYHAGVIALAAGDTDAGRGYLEAALGIRGGLDPLATTRATAELERLEAAR
jgi:Tfp pilus assembly protein PilF